MAEQETTGIGWFVAGLGLGALLGILFAPKAGTETRGFIRDKANEGVDYVKRRGEDLRDTAAETLDRTKERLRRQKENLAAAVDAGTVGTG